MRGGNCLFSALKTVQTKSLKIYFREKLVTISKTLLNIRSLDCLKCYALMQTQKIKAASISTLQYEKHQNPVWLHQLVTVPFPW